MIDYVYTARNQSGDVVKANVKADSPQAAAKLLKEQQLFAVDIVPVDENDVMHRLGLGSLGGRIKTKDKVLFTRQLSTLINAGLPLSRALHNVQDQVTNKNLRAVVSSIAAAVEGGSSLASAFAQYPKVFNQIYISLVAAGETSGTLDKALLRLANQQEKDAAIAGKIRSALIYPLIVSVLIVGVIIMMLTTVVPQVASLYKDLGKSLPFITQILIAMSNVIVHYWYVLLVLLGGAGFGLKSIMATEKAKLFMDGMKTKIPIFGPLFVKVYMARFARTMHTLLATGVPMLQAMATTHDAIGNRLVATDIEGAIKLVKGGKALSEGLEKGSHFLPLVPQMISIGEESGTIDDMLERVAVMYENEVDEAVKNLSTTLEPVMMVVLGGVVALLIAAVLGPVYSLIGGGATNPSTLK